MLKTRNRPRLERMLFCACVLILGSPIAVVHAEQKSLIERVAVLDQKSATMVGAIVPSMLTWEELLRLDPEAERYWIPADGREVPPDSFYFQVKSVDGEGPVMAPDLRGQFLRGKNNGRETGGNPDGELDLGVQQEDLVKSHGHGITDKGHRHPVSRGYSTKGGYKRKGGGELTNGSYGGPNIEHFAKNSPTGVEVKPAGGLESRPRNVTVNYFMRIN